MGWIVVAAGRDRHPPGIDAVDLTAFIEPDVEDDDDQPEERNQRRQIEQGRFCTRTEDHAAVTRPRVVHFW